MGFPRNYAIGSPAFWPSIKVVIDGACSNLKPVNAGVPQGCVLSPTLFLLHINDMLKLSNIHCYADDSTGDTFYTGRAGISRAVVDEYRNKLVSEVETLLRGVSDWGRQNLFNPKKTQVCAFSAKKTPFVATPLFENTLLKATASIGILGVDISSDVQFRGHLEGKAKLASKKLAVRIVDDQSLFERLDPLALRRDVGSLCIFYRIYHGECSEELFGLIPAAEFHHRTSRQNTKFHPYHLDVCRSTTERFSRQFLPRTTTMWNQLPIEVFPNQFDLGTFKKRAYQFLKGRQRTREPSGIESVHGGGGIT
ncbi:unnamed protein product [Pieris macdunnoughi]|uniref:Reverse transcriptase domain-containing protein n=1 Tax=Pieris macdunnoughi TaxID=345717 RepID=A0A821Q332_9NEOP|nr:unnamed protein product [Pieris macdunnoughi]